MFWRRLLARSMLFAALAYLLGVLVRRADLQGLLDAAGAVHRADLDVRACEARRAISRSPSAPSPPW